MGKVVVKIFLFSLILNTFTIAKILKVGTYHNPPKIALGETQIPEGIFIDILEFVAKKEKWSIKYISGKWEECLRRLEEGSIDLLPDVAISPERIEKFDLNKIPVLYSWLQLYTRKGVEINNISDLAGKRIGVLKGSIQEKECFNLQKSIAIEFTILTFLEYKELEEEIANGKIDAIVVSRFYGYNKKRKSDILEPTSIILKPTSLHFAVKKGTKGELLATIDKHLSMLLRDPHSIYYKSFEKWFHEKSIIHIPPYIIWGLLSVTIIALFFIIQTITLRYLVKERTKEIEEKNSELSLALEQLKRAQEEALRRERLYAFGQLAMGIAHDFNNLLQPILGWSDMMLTNPDELSKVDEVKESFRKIHAAARYGSEIVNKMRKIYRSSLELEKKRSLDLNEIIEEVLELVKGRISGSISVKKQLCEKAIINARKSEMHEMILNLILNAIDAMPEGGTLEIFTKDKEESIELVIKDNGIGMTEEIRQKCLQPFFTTKGENGTGMGLTMVNNIVTEHNGTLHIESEYKKGTTFIITFKKEKNILT